MFSRLPEIRDRILYEHRWDFATQLKRLDFTTWGSNSPAYDHRAPHIYSIPNEVLRIWGVNNADKPLSARGISTDDTSFESSRDVLTVDAMERVFFSSVSHATSGADFVWVWATLRIENVSLWSPLFVENVIAELALFHAWRLGANPQQIQLIAGMTQSRFAMTLFTTGKINNVRDLLAASGFDTPEPSLATPPPRR